MSIKIYELRRDLGTIKFLGVHKVSIGKVYPLLCIVTNRIMEFKIDKIRTPRSNSGHSWSPEDV